MKTLRTMAAPLLWSLVVAIVFAHLWLTVQEAGPSRITVPILGLDH